MCVYLIFAGEIIQNSCKLDKVSKNGCLTGKGSKEVGLILKSRARLLICEKFFIPSKSLERLKLTEK